MNPNEELALSIDAALQIRGTDWHQIAMAAGVTPSELESGLAFFGKADRRDLQRHLNSYEADIQEAIESAESTGTTIPPRQECREYLWSIAVRSRRELVSAILERASEYALVAAEERARTHVGIRPLEDRVLIQPLAKEHRTEAGIYLPESAKEKPMQGRVVAHGPGKLMGNGERIHATVKKGDVVVYSMYAGTEIDIKNVRHLIVRESELLGIIEGEAGPFENG